MSGEETQAKGADGARRAKRWLELTTRVNVQWVNPEPAALPKLTFNWENKGHFSFDLGGSLVGEDLDGQLFYAEVKNYKKEQDLRKHFMHFLGCCYRAYILSPNYCDNFMWISWAPFDAHNWDKHATPEKVRDSALENAERIFGASKDEAPGLVNDDTCKQVSDRLWMITLSEKQEKLTLTRKHLGVIRQHDTERGL